MELGVQEIKKIIPHRYPFLLIDRVIEVKPKEYLVAVKNVSVNEMFFNGHFPEEKVMPGVLIVEAMAQAACVYGYFSQGWEGRNLIYYLGKVTARFIRPVRPGDRLEIRISTVKLLAMTGIVKAEASVDGQAVAAAEIAFGVKEA